MQCYIRDAYSRNFITSGQDDVLFFGRGYKNKRDWNDLLQRDHAQYFCAQAKQEKLLVRQAQSNAFACSFQRFLTKAIDFILVIQTLHLGGEGHWEAADSKALSKCKPPYDNNK